MKLRWVNRPTNALEEYPSGQFPVLQVAEEYEVIKDRCVVSYKLGEWEDVPFVESWEE